MDTLSKICYLFIVAVMAWAGIDLIIDLFQKDFVGCVSDVGSLALGMYMLLRYHQEEHAYFVSLIKSKLNK